MSLLINKKQMWVIFSRFIFVIFLAAFGSLTAQAQFPDASTRNGIPRRDDLPKSIQENLLKGKIKEEERKHEEMLKRGEEAAQLSDELSKSFESNKTLSDADIKKLSRLETLVKKIRSDLGGSDDKDSEAEDAPSSLISAMKAVQENASNLLSALKKTTRHSISAVAIESSNAVLKLVRFIRFYKN